MDSNLFYRHLTEDIIPFWNHLKDEAHGGFCGFVGSDLREDWESDKGVILNSRILWFYSNAYLVLKDAQLLRMAEHAYRFLREHCLDGEHGGVYWSVHFDGRPADDTKHTYNQAFAIYALASYYEAGCDEEALETAYGLYRLIEEKCRDGEGYLEAFHRDFSPDSNEKLSENGVMAERTMNTLLHVMEAYTELYRVDGRREIRDSLCEVLELFAGKIYDPDKKICDVFFDREYQTLIDLESYGHDIEASWLLERTLEVMGEEEYTQRLLPVSDELAQTAYEHAYDNVQHGLNNEREENRVDRQKIWWVQAEAVVGFYNAYRRGGERYLAAAESIWQFIREHVIDERSGEWFESVKADGSTDPAQGLVHEWKCPYHNGRMCLEMLKRLAEPNFARMHKPQKSGTAGEKESGTEENSGRGAKSGTVKEWEKVSGVPAIPATANPHSTQEARELLGYLRQTAGNGIITGQHTQTNPMEEIAYIREVTGREPKLRGFELLAYSPNINCEDASPECLKEVCENRDTVETALQWARETQGIVTLTFHWFSPIGGRDKSFYAENTDFDASRILQKGTPEREAFYRDMDRIAVQLEKFRAAGIPVLWRPFHEADGTWFWWGAKGPRVARQLYRLMFDHYTVEKGLDNLLWVWNCVDRAGYPGDARVDVVSADVYLSEYRETDYQEEYRALVAATSRNKVAALAEVGYLPDVGKLAQSGVTWAYFMLWSKEFCIGEQYNSEGKLRDMYGSGYAVTIDT